MNVPAIAMFAITPLLLAACASEPTPIGPHADPALVAIRDEYSLLVSELRADDWHSGWMGNTAVNVLGGNESGLCWQWQRVVYERVRPIARSLGWDAIGIVVNDELPGVHRAVIVFDPARTPRTALALRVSPQAAPAGPAPAAYVLDPWRRAEPDVFDLDDWLAHAADPVRTVKLEVPPPLNAEPRPAPGR